MELRVLGAVEVLVDGAPARLGGPKQKTVLSLLAVELGRVVSSDRLIDSLWGQETPSGARHTLQTYVSNLRSELGEVVVREGPGYRLDLPRDQMDAARFEDEVEAARALVIERPLEAATRLREALALWRGDAYADQAGSPALDLEARRLEELRLNAVEDRIEAELALGLHAELVGELEVLAAEHQPREIFRAQHMLALYRSGRQAEALRAYQKTRSYLAEELGIDPSPSLRELEQRILEQDTTLDPPSESRVEVLAFLFSDVEDSTLLWELHPGTVQQAFTKHDRIITDAVEEAGGRVFNHTGDGICAVFPEAARAVSAAQAAQVGLASAHWGEAPPLKVRMAIDVGEVESKGTHFLGPPLNRCARVMASGHGGQVLLSADAHTALSKAPGSGWQVRALGEYHFRGLGRSQPVFQLGVEGLPSEFPPLVVDRQPPPLPGAGLGRSVRGYELREQVGGGDFGVVYRAYQPSVGREVAVKVIRPELINQPAFVRLFEAEARLVASLEHPHVVALYDFWRDPDGAYLVMRWMRGGSLRRSLERGPWHLEPALRLLTEIGRALSYAHRQGVVHRDLKPSNVLLDEEGSAYLSDFGIAARLTDASETGRPQSTSPAYLAPEELRGEPLRPGSDIYALGLLAFEVLAGRRPPMDGPLLSLHGLRPELPVEVDDVIAEAIREDPESRFPSVESFLGALSEALGKPPVAEPISYTPIRNPYKGLHAFGERDAQDFFGRDAAVAELVGAVAEHRLVGVVGPSGIGKSSVVRAGLLPALRAGALPRSREWLFTDMFPGAYPFEELEEALLRVAVERPASLVEELRRDERGAARVIKQVLPPDGELVVLIDQFEELFTLTSDEDTRGRFMDALAEVASDPRSRTRVVLTLRADFFDRPLRYPRFGELLRAGMVALTAPGEGDLAQAVERPAEGVGVRFEPGLVSRIVADVQEQPGALPLLQYALTELFASRTSDLLTIPGYRATGGVLGALGRRAEELYGQQDREGQEITRQVFLRLVSVSETAEDTRRRVLKRELRELGVDPKLIDQVLGSYGEYRLLTFDRDPLTRGPTVEVAHEALLNEWSRLRDWINERREDLLLHRRLAEAVAEWEASSRSSEFLLQRGRLDHFETWAASTDLFLTDTERDFLVVSRIEENRSRRRLTRGRWSIVAGLALAVFVIALLALSARDQARVATARELAAESIANLDDDPELSILLALEAVEAMRSAGGSVLPEVIEALHQSTVASRIELSFPAEARAADWSPDGRLIATVNPVGDPSLVSLRDSVTGEVVHSWPAHGSGVNDVVFSPDGSSLATAGNDGAVVLWTVDQRNVIRVLQGPNDTDQVWGISFTPDGNLLAALWWDAEARESTARILEVDTGVMIREVVGLEGATAEPAQSTALSPDGSRVAIAPLGAPEEGGGWVWIVDVGSGEVERIQADPVWGASTVAWRPQGDRLATGAFGGLVRLWEPGSAESLLTLEPGGSVERIDWSADGSRLATLTTDGKARVWQVEEDRARVLYTLAVRDVVQAGWSHLAFSPDGDRLLTGNHPGDLVIWDLTVTGDQEVLNLAAEDVWFGDVAYAPDGKTIAGSVPGARARIWDSETGEALLTIEGHQSVLPGGDEPLGVAVVAFSPDGSLMATGGRDPTMKLWRSDNGELLFTFEGHTDWIEDIVFSPDGRYLATASSVFDRTARIVDATTGSEVHAFPHGDAVFSLAFTPDGRQLITGSSDGSVRIWDTRAGSLLDTIEVGAGVRAVALSPNGTRLVLGTTDSTASVWDFAARTKLVELAGHLGEVWSVAFSPDGSRVATGSADSTIRLWNPDSGVTELVLRGHSFVVRNLAFHPDGSRLASIAAPNDAIRIWALDLDELVSIAQRELTRSLTEEECRQYLHVDQCP